jgi:hypothetical protein
MGPDEAMPPAMATVQPRNPDPFPKSRKILSLRKKKLVKNIIKKINRRMGAIRAVSPAKA